MATRGRYLTLEGHFERQVLGTFQIIRGFADLRDLASLSVPYEMEDGGSNGRVRGQQRQIDPAHATRIKAYLEKGHQRFLPEVILSVRAELDDELDEQRKPVGVRSRLDALIRIERTSKAKNRHVHRIRIERSKVGEVCAAKLVRRVDGNHRLALASGLTDEPTLPTKYLAPFCAVLLGDVSEAADDYSESLIFHTINSTALPLESEHSLRLILGQAPDHDMSPEQEFAFSPDLHFTRLLRDGLQKLPKAAQKRLGDRPLTGLRSAVRGLLELDPGSVSDIKKLTEYADEVLGALNEIAIRLAPQHPALCKAEFFIELATRAWRASNSDQKDPSRVDEAVKLLEQLSSWLGNDGLLGLKEGQSISKQIIEVFRAVQARVPKRLFLARWYPTAKDGTALTSANLRLEQIKAALKTLKEVDGISLELLDLGTEEGGTFPIHAKMYDAIASADIILLDLTGVRPNVCVEAGYALRNHESNRLIFLFQPTKDHPKVPFDLNTFRYEEISEAAEVPTKIIAHIKAIIANAKLGE